MREHSAVYVGLDTSKLRNAVAIAAAGREGEVSYLGEIDNTAEATGKLVRRLARRHGTATFCYEAGPTGYGLYRHITELGQACIVVAPSLIPQRPGERVKTNRRDAVSLAKLLRAGELTAVWVPDPHHEAIRDLTRARDAAVREQRRLRQQVSALLLRQGRPGVLLHLGEQLVERLGVRVPEPHVVSDEQQVGAQHGEAQQCATVEV